MFASIAWVLKMGVLFFLSDFPLTVLAGKRRYNASCRIMWSSRRSSMDFQCMTSPQNRIQIFSCTNCFLSIRTFNMTQLQRFPRVSAPNADLFSHFLPSLLTVVIVRFSCIFAILGHLRRGRIWLYFIRKAALLLQCAITYPSFITLSVIKYWGQ